MKRISLVLGVFLVLVLLATAARSEQSPEEVRAGIIDNLYVNYHACNEENMSKLLKTMSREMPNRELFQQVTRREWAAGDTYSRLEDVEVLAESDAPNSNCVFPYATAWVTQTVVQVSGERKNVSVFKSRCKNGKCDGEDLAHKMGLATKTETTKLQMLFKYENGEWKLIAGLTDPIPAGPDAQQAERENETPESAVPARPGAAQKRAERSVFN
jgi:hypothetical protein